MGNTWTWRLILVRMYLVISKKTFDKLNLTGCVLTKSPRHLIVANGQSVVSVYSTPVYVRYKNTKACIVLCTSITIILRQRPA